jgi:hypothetical protein
VTPGVTPVSDSVPGTNGGSAANRRRSERPSRHATKNTHTIPAPIAGRTGMKT